MSVSPQVRWTLLCAAAPVLAAMPALAAAPFTVIALPDTQNYVGTNDRNETYNKGQTRWIRDNRQALDIKFVMHLGDLQNPGNPYYARTDNIYLPDFSRPTGWVDNDVLWQRAASAMRILDNNNIPYSTLAGNHDYLRNASNVGRLEPIYYLEHFGPQHHVGKPTFGGYSTATPTMPYEGMNTWHKFEGNGYQFLNIALQFDPDSHDLRWAQKIINENPGLPTILTTHAYITNGGYQAGYTNIWDNFVKLNPQVVMTVNGHITGEHRVIDTNIAGQQVHQMLVDYQATEFTGYYQGGGYLRTMEFDTDANIVRVKSYSPVTNAYLTDADSQFNIPLNFKNRFGLPNGQGIQQSASFQQGVNGYTGTRDTFLDAAAPTTNYGEATTAWVDGDRDGATAGQQQSHGLIRFDFLDSQIPANAIVKSAELVIHTSALSNSQSGNTMSLYRLLKGWQEPTATWDSQTNGISADAVDAIFAANDSVSPSVQDQFLTFDVTESLWAWLAGAPNNGWALLPGGTDGWQWDTSESGNVLNRPRLNVDYLVSAPGLIQWNSTSGDWTSAANWVGGRVPGGADQALLAFTTPGATVQVNTDVADIFSLSVRNGNVLSIGAGGDVRNSGQSFDDPQHAFRIGDGSAGTVIVNGGKLANVSSWATSIQGADIYVGVGAGGNGTLTQSGAGSLVQSRDIRIGSGAGATGVYNHNGGTAQVNWLLAGREGGNGTYNLNGGTLNANQLRVGSGSGSTGNASIQSGVANVAVDAYVGVDGALGAVTQSGGSLNVTNNLIVGTGSGGGVFSNGTFNQSGGTVTVGSGLLIGLGGALGRYELSGGTLNAGQVTNGGTFIHTGGAANIGALTGTGTTTVGAGVNLAADRVAQGTVNVNGTMTIRPNGNVSGVSRIDNITLGSAGRIDLTNNKLITRMAAGTWNGTAYDGVAGMVDSGRGASGNALWNGASGIITSDPRAIDNGDLLSIGVAKVGDFKGIADGAITTFAGQTVTGSDIVAMVTWGGDATLDGKINIDDYGRIDANVAASGSVFGWFNGDFNYDGKINIDDYGIIDGNIGRQGAAFVTGGASFMEEVSAVPEPAAAVILAGMAAGSLLRRRRV